MQGFQINEYFNSFPNLTKHYKGIFAIDTLPRIIKLRQFLICNTDLSSGSGAHWFCLLRTSKNTLECFDSLGITDDKKKNLELYCHVKGVKDIEFNETPFQLEHSDSCGLYCVYYIIKRMYNLDLDFEHLLEEIFDDKNKEENELVVKQFCDSVKQF